MDKDFMLNYFNKAVQPEWEKLLKTPRYQPAASKRDAIEREFFRMLNDEQKRKYLDLESAVILAECDIAEALYMKGATDREMRLLSQRILTGNTFTIILFTTPLR